jgi:ribosomal protein L36
MNNESFRHSKLTMDNENENTRSNSDATVESVLWTTDPNLENNSITLSTLCSTTDYGENDCKQQYFQYQEGKHSISLIQQEDIASRKPFLSRALIPISTSASSRSSLDGFDVFRAADAVPGYWSRPKKDTGKLAESSSNTESTPSVPSSVAVSMLQHRLDNFVYQTVLNEWLRHLVVMAAIEECRYQFLQQCVVAGTSECNSATSRSNGIRTGTSSSSSSSSNDNNKVMELLTSSPPYYRQTPTSYLSAPTNISTSNVSTSTQSDLIPGFEALPVHFSPSQLVQRIKQGCSLVWRYYERRLPSAFLSPAAASDRRSSTRLTRQQMDYDMNSIDDDPNDEWKVLPGGLIASFLRDKLILKQMNADNHQDVVRVNGIQDSDSTVQKEDHEGDLETEEREEHENNDIDVSLLKKNPYVLDVQSAILEWLGRKTAKLLTTTDIQPTFPSLLPPKIKSTKKKWLPSSEEMELFGVNVLEYLSPVDLRIWKRMVANSYTLDDNSSPRLYLKIVNDEDTSRLEDWEASSFGRSQFTIRIWNEAATMKLTQQVLESYTAAETEYKEKKAWATWRHKGITSGHTTWPSWLKTIEAWRKQESYMDDDKSKSNVSEMETDKDLELAKSIAEQEAAATSAVGSRRSRRAAGEGGNVGVFYGAQANLNHKQLMDALLRLISISSYQTSSSLASTVLDNSSDPHRRIRYAVGKLLWKRNQISRVAADPCWSDNHLIKTVNANPLLTIDPEIAQTLPVNATSVERDCLVDYVRDLHKTELCLRQLVMENISAVPVGIIATSADEKAGSLEAADSLEFDSEDSNIQWMTSGHKLLKCIIFRPPSSDCSDEITPCQWFKVKDYCESVAAIVDDVDTSNDRPQIGRAKECTLVKRRQRFRVISTSAPSKAIERQKMSNKTVLVLTEAQVCAGLKAAEIETKRLSLSEGFHENPYVGSNNRTVTLVPTGRSTSLNLQGLVVGHDCFIEVGGSVFHRILVLLNEDGRKSEARWASLIFRDQGTIDCVFENETSIYTLQRFEYQPGSDAFKECRGIIQFLSRHAKAGPFMEPVDPIALGIPHYNDIIKTPMDISTLSSNLEKGVYSNFASKQSTGKSPITRMINGPFRRDVELIFDNAMLFNPPDDWIHLAAAAMKKAVCKKIDQISSTYEHSRGRSSAKSSMYVDEDSDFEMEEFESEQEEYIANGGRRKRKSSSAAHTIVREEASTRSIERPLKLQKLLSDAYGVRGALMDMPIVTDVTTFSIPPGWGCRFAVPKAVSSKKSVKQDTELDEMIALHKMMDERDFTSRRSTRAAVDEVADRSEDVASVSTEFEFYPLNNPLAEVKCDGSSIPFPHSRLQLEQLLETLHENHFAKMFQQLQKHVKPSSDDLFGVFSDGSFPPYLGRLTPQYLDSKVSEKRECPVNWEIRDTYLVPALRWIIRGLIRSEHLSEQEPIDSATEAGSILPNFVYYYNPNLQPFEVIDGRESTKKKRPTNGDANGVIDDDVKLSEYEKMRAERVARNAERLKLLGLT